MKVLPTKANFIQSTIVRIVNLGNNNEIPNTINMKNQKWSGILCQTITMCRHNAQTLARKNYEDNKRSNQIPDSFPGTVLITENKNTNSENRKSFRTTISNIFILSHEAFALLFLYNDYNLWLNTTKGTRKRKTLTESKSGNREGWSTQGRILYKCVLSEIEKRRKERHPKDLEIELLKTYQQQNGKHTPQDDEDRESKKEQRRKEQCDMIETLSKDDKDYKFYIKCMKSLPK
eukprot:jgi/Psemu1/6391/gm1.6391_g